MRASTRALRLDLALRPWYTAEVAVEAGTLFHDADRQKKIYQYAWPRGLALLENGRMKNILGRKV
ncbi:MAG TPA: hypothetical protein VGI19_12965, partial [Candidatus Cybelea sp.]